MRMTCMGQNETYPPLLPGPAIAQLLSSKHSDRQSMGSNLGEDTGSRISPHTVLEQWMLAFAVDGGKGPLNRPRDKK